MNRNTFTGLLLLLLVGMFTVSAAERLTAGKVIWATGDVTAVAATGGSRALARSTKVYSDDTVQTGEGRTKIRFTDDGVMSLLPHSQLRIAEYRYAKADTDTSRLELLKGGARLVTGLVAKDRKENFRLETNAGYIGVRGTEFDVRACQADCQSRGSTRRFPQGVYARVLTGAIVLGNDAGQLVAKAGEIALMAHKGKAPQLVARFPDEGFDVDDPTALPSPDTTPEIPTAMPPPMPPPMPPAATIPPGEVGGYTPPPTPPVPPPVTPPSTPPLKVYVPPPPPPPPPTIN